MAIGGRIRHFRTLMGLTQKQLGELLGFKGKSSDVRMAQYESEARVPKFDLTKQMAEIFGVSTHALNVPNIDSYTGIMHTLFTLEDLYGLKAKKIDGQLCLVFDSPSPAVLENLVQDCMLWQEKNAAMESGAISKDEYDEWRYNFPANTDGFTTVPSKATSDYFVEKLGHLIKD